MSYAQHNEDIFLVDLIKKHGIGLPATFIDIGACDGIHLSNTRLFADIGWSGVMIEPSNYYYSDLEKNYIHRDDVVTVQGAVADFDGKGLFYFNPNKPDHSGLHKSKDNEPDSVYCMTYQTIINDIAPFEMLGILSVDAEGMDTEILKQVMMSDTKPVIIIAESNTLKERQIHLDLLNKEYHLLNVLSVNTVWIKRSTYERYCSTTEL